jgi:signal transduction histidine kinase
MIVQRIVQEHGGMIELASKPDRGTVFTILLPLDERRVRLLNAPKTADLTGGKK